VVKDLFNDRVENETTHRTCEDAKSQSIFCYCDQLPEPKIALSEDLFSDSIAQVVAEANRVTGNGTLACVSLSSEEFNITGSIQPTKVGFTINVRHFSGVPTYEAQLDKQRNLRIGATKFGQVGGLIMRKDHFSDECCLVDVEDYPPTFAMKVQGFDALPRRGSRAWEQAGYTANPHLNLRYCRCKDDMCAAAGEALVTSKNDFFRR